MSLTTLLPLGTMVYFKGCVNNPHPDFGWITSHEPEWKCSYCSVREEEVFEPHYSIDWADGSSHMSTHLELEGEDFIILEEICK